MKNSNITKDYKDAKVLKSNYENMLTYSFMPSTRNQNFTSFNLHCHLTQHWKQKTYGVEWAAIYN